MRYAVEDACGIVTGRIPDPWVEAGVLEEIDNLEGLRELVPDQVCPFDDIEVNNVSQARELSLELGIWNYLILSSRRADRTTVCYSAQRLSLP